MSFPPFDSSAPSHNPPPPRPAYSQTAYSYDQPAYGNMGYGDLRYPPTMQAYTPTDPNANGDYMNPSFSPTASQFAADQYGPGPNSESMTYTPRRRYQSTGGVLQSSGHYPVPRRPSADMAMPTMQESFEYVPSQPVDPTRPGSARGSSSGDVSALALERPYECDLCQTRFARQHDCKRHRETHAVNASGEKPHHCVVCGKSFTRKDALKRHTNQKGCDTSMGHARSSRSSDSSSPQQRAGTFYPIGSLPHGASGSHYY